METKQRAFLGVGLKCDVEGICTYFIKNNISTGAWICSEKGQYSYLIM